MILEFSIDYRSSSLVYEKIFLDSLKEHSLNGKIIKNHFSLKLYVEAEDIESLENFITNFSLSLPHSIYLYENGAQMVEKMPDGEYKFPTKNKKAPLSSCLKCSNEVMDSKSENYYNIFKECDVCGYGIDGEKENYKEKLQQAAKDIKSGKTIQLNTFYGKYIVGLPSKICNDYKCDLVAYDYATVDEYMNATEDELKAIASLEKPFIKLARKMKFVLDYESVERELFRCKLPDDLILHFLMQELFELNERLIFISKDKIDYNHTLHLVEPKEELEPIEIVVSSSHRAILRGRKGLPKPPELKDEAVPSQGALLSIMREHKLDFDNIASLYLSKEHGSSLIAHGKKYGFVKCLDFKFNFSSMKEIFQAISQASEISKKLVDNYTKKFPEHIEKIENISWESSKISIYELWGIIAIALNFTQTKNIHEAAQDLEDNNNKFLGDKGPRIDYVLIKEDTKAILDPLKVLRSAMSFKLAGVDDLMLSYGIMESFAEFISHELDLLKDSMDIEVIALSGSMLENKKLFKKLCKESSINHKLYTHNELPVDSYSIFVNLKRLEGG